MNKVVFLNNSGQGVIIKTNDIKDVLSKGLKTTITCYNGHEYYVKETVQEVYEKMTGLDTGVSKKDVLRDLERIVSASNAPYINAIDVLHELIEKYGG